VNWAECKSLAEGFLHRSDLALDSLQPLAVADCNIALLIQENEGGGSITLAEAGDGLWFAPLPADYSAMRAVDVGGVMCDPVPYRTLRQSGAGRRWYAVSGMSLYAARSGVADILYSKRVLPASDGGTNPILDRYPQVYLYALLKHAAVVVQDFEAAQVFERQFVEHVGAANALYHDAAFGPGMAVSAIPGGM
jgi:hypothetical protein